MPTKNSFLTKPYTWAFTTYFAEGFPYSIIRTLSSIFFRDRGMSLEAIGVTSVYGLPWVIKFLWGPLVDSFGTKKKWLLSTQAILCAFFLAVALLAPIKQAIPLIAALLFLASFIAATHDIAIDGYYMEALDKDGQAKYVGYRVMAYRIAMMTGTGVIATIGAKYSWFSAFLLGTFIMSALLIFHRKYLPACGQEQQGLARPFLLFIKRNIFKIILAVIIILACRSFLVSETYSALQSAFPALKKLTFPGMIGLFLFIFLLAIWFFRKKISAKITRNPDSFYARSFITFMDRDHIGIIIAFIVFIRTGEYMLSSMYSPFIVDLGIKEHYGWISAGVGLPFSIVGAMTGGWLISKYSLKKMIWPFLLLQNFTNLVYMFLAFNLNKYVIINTGNQSPLGLSNFEMFKIAATHGFDQFSGGLGTAVLMTFLMRICLVEFKASHYAIGTGLMSVSGLYAGVVSGFIASSVGYGYFFGISFLMSIPGMLLIFWLPTLDSERKILGPAKNKTKKRPECLTTRP